MENPCQRHGIEAGAIWKAPLVPFLCFLSSFSFLLLRSNVTGPGVRLDTGPMGLRGLSSGWIDCQPTFCHVGLWESLRAKLASAHLKRKALCGISPMAVAKEEEENREQLKSRDHLNLVSHLSLCVNMSQSGKPDSKLTRVRLISFLIRTNATSSWEPPSLPAHLVQFHWEMVVNLTVHKDHPGVYLNYGFQGSSSRYLVSFGMG